MEINSSYHTQYFVWSSYVHGRVDFRNSFVVGWKLVYLNTVADQLTHDLDLEFLKFTFGNSVCLRDDGDNVDLNGSKQCTFTSSAFSVQMTDCKPQNHHERHECFENNTLLSSFFIVTKSRDFNECPVGEMK